MWALAAVAVLVVAPGAWLGRYGINPDGLSYLDMAAGAVRSDAANLINLYWSPLYPTLLAGLLVLLKPEGVAEFATAQLLNLLLLALAAAALAYLVLGMPKSARTVVALTFAVFLWALHSTWLAQMVTPDLLVGALVYGAAGLALRLQRSPTTWRAVVLGSLLAAGYYAKAVMLPLGFCLLGLLWLARLPRRLVLIAAAVFVAGSLPVIAMMSAGAGRLTTGESGKLNYAWSSNGVPSFFGWRGGPPGNGTPVHPPRVIAKQPLVLEYNGPVGGTVPLWYRPAYWYEGLKLRFDARGQWIALRRSLGNLWKLVIRLSALLLGLLALLALRRWREPAFASGFAGNWWLAGWPICALVLYSIVRFEERYFAVFLPVLTLGLLGVIRPRRGTIEVLISAGVAVALIVPAVSGLPGQWRQIAQGNPRPEASPDYRASLELRALGIGAGDRIALLAFPLTAYDIHLTGARVVAHSAPAREFWKLEPDRAERIYAALHKAGVTAVVAQEAPPPEHAAGWLHRKDGTRWVRFLAGDR